MRHSRLDIKKPKPWDKIKNVTLARTIGKTGWNHNYVLVKRSTFMKMIKELNSIRTKFERYRVMRVPEGTFIHPPKKKVCKLTSCSVEFLTGHNNTKFHSKECREKYWNGRNVAEAKALRALGKKFAREGRDFDPKSEEAMEYMDRIVAVVDQNL